MVSPAYHALHHSADPRHYNSNFGLRLTIFDQLFGTFLKPGKTPPEGGLEIGIQGESSYAGNPTVFIRTTGCNLRCTYCDTKYSYDEGEFWSFEKILNSVKDYGAEYVCITGGEPLLQKEIHQIFLLYAIVVSVLLQIFSH